MKKLFFLIAAAITFGFTSCSEDECDHIIGGGITPIDNPFIGSWYSDDSNEEITYNKSGTLYDRYCNLQNSAETEGRWEYDRDNKKLTQRYNFLGQAQFVDWKVEYLAETEIKLKSDKNGECVMERIVACYNLEVGETVQFSFPKEIYNCKDKTYVNLYKATSFSSLNPYLASVDDNGKIEATGEKGTTYIKVKTDHVGNNGESKNVWIKIVIGEECLDIWYDWPQFIGADFSTVSKAMGQYSATGDDGRSFGWNLSTFNLRCSKIDMFFNPQGYVEQMALILKNIPETEVIAYMNSHYYLVEGSDGIYSTCKDVEKSRALVKYYKDMSSVFFFNNSFYLIQDYSKYLGMTKNELVSLIGNPGAESGNRMRYLEDNNYFLYTDYTIDTATGQISTIVNKMANNSLALFIQDKIRKTFAEVYDYADDSDYANQKYAFINKPTIDEATVEIIVEGKSGTGFVTYVDLKGFREWPDYTSAFGQTVSQIVANFGPLDSDGDAYYLLLNHYAAAVWFGFANNKVVDYQLYFNQNISINQIHSILGDKYLLISDSETANGPMYVYRDEEDLQKGKVQIQYYPNQGTAIFFDLDYYVRGITRSCKNLSESIFESKNKATKFLPKK